MAAADESERVTGEVVCSICLNLFKDPVTTDCGHNFCRVCITELCEKSNRNVFCPQCQTKLVKKNLRLKQQLEIATEGIQNTNLKELQPDTCLKVEQERSKEGLICRAHNKTINLFCEEEKQAVCSVCCLSNGYCSHNVIPIEEAIRKYKEKLAKSICSLNEQMGRNEILQKEEAKHIREIKSFSPWVSTEKEYPAQLNYLSKEMQINE
ncbi:E3 ubiquitin-protein ligase TRIM52-like [Protopterus annectens]|uniref:E3 ubiquitin-protein ligase TRIM52-like n=1 Tax=Protopterus annectens TaxID=7888 RepID=UPI001CF97B83|nr:E3 ubiquitin-protein ligase TRIM52-like [Protopterus annectens]